MAKKLISVQGGIGIAVAVSAALALLWFASTKAPGPSDVSVQWDEAESKSLMMALHRTHEEANAGNMQIVKDAYIGDDALVTFEMDPDQATPVALRSKKEIDAHMDRAGKGIAAVGTLLLDGPKMHCKATATFGVCTEECTIRIKRPDGTESVDHFFGSGTAIKVGGEWKWVQYHMSVGAPRDIVLKDNVKDSKVETPAHEHG